MIEPLHRRAFSRCDARYYQIAALLLLLFYGLVRLNFEVSLSRAIVILATVLLAQYCCSRAWKLKSFDPKSALISGLSLCLLLRTNSLILAAVTAAVTIASKFVLRWNSKHIFNPTNFGLVFMMLCSDRARTDASGELRLDSSREIDMSNG